MTHIEIVRTDADQPWHARLRAANGEPTWTTENYAEKRGALDAVELLGRMFSPVTLARLSDNGYSLDVWHDSDELGAKFAIPVTYVDERAERPDVPTCILCRRERTLEDAYDYNPLQVLTGRPVGWYSGDDGEICPECMTKTLRGQL